MARCKILQAECNGVHILKLVGEVRLSHCSAIDLFIDNLALDKSFATLVVDLSETTLIDSTTLGLLAKLARVARKHSHFLPSIISVNPDITRVLTTMGFDSIYLIVNAPVSEEHTLVELAPKAMDESQMRDKVLSAHKVLMELNEHNREQFKDLVCALELESEDSLSTKVG